MTAKKSAKRVSKVGRPRADQIESRKEALLDAATEVFLEVGYTGARMSLIAEKAGASMETLYARYPTKAELFTGIVERKCSSMLNSIGPLSPDREPREALTTYGTKLVATMTGPNTQKLHRLVIAGSIDSPELGSIFWNAGPGRGFHVVRAYLEEQKLRGTLSIEDIDRSCDLLIAMFVGGTTLQATLGVPFPIQTREAQQKWAAYVVDIFLSTLK